MLKNIAPLLCICSVLALPVSAAAQRPEADLCAVVPGAQPLLPAKLLQGMGDTNMPVTTNRSR